MGRILAVWITGFVCAGLLPTSVQAQKDAPSFAANSDANLHVLDVLKQPLREAGLEFSDTPLEEVLAYLSDEYEIQILIDQQALEDLGVDVAIPMTIKLRNVSLESALRLMLKDHELSYVVADGVLLITTQETECSRLVVCAYPVQDLLDTSYKPTKEDLTLGVPSELVPLTHTLITTIASDTWAENGGGESSISGMRPGLLVISQTQAVHEEIRNTLAAIRRAKQYAEQNQPAATPAEVGGGGGFGGRGFGGEEGGGFGRGGFGGEGRGQNPPEKPADEDPFGR